MYFKQKISESGEYFSFHAEGWESALQLDAKLHPISWVQSRSNDIKAWTDREVTISLPAGAGWGDWVAAWIAEPIRANNGVYKYWSQVAEATLQEAAGMRMECPLERRSRSVFLAAVRRGRKDTGKLSEEIWKQACTVEFPLVDSLPSGHFQHEFALLDRDQASYDRDLKRAIRFCAFMPCGHDHKLKVHEGIWIEDPESVLFTDWAWRDLKNSTEHAGFALVVVRQGQPWRIAANPAKDLHLDELAGKIRDETGKSWLQAPAMKISGKDIQTVDSNVGWRSLWCNAMDVDRDQLEKAIREYCEGALFEKGAEWVCGEAELRPWPDEPRTNEKPRIDFIRCQLNEQVGHRVPETAARVIYLGLWTLVRPAGDRRQGAPVKFGDHCQGDSGLLTVWSRSGLAAGWSDPAANSLAKNLMDQLEQFCEKLSALWDRSDALAKVKREDETAKTVQGRIYVGREFLSVRADLTHPRYRLVRRLFERLDFATAHSSHVDLQLTSEIAKLTDESQKLTKQNHAIEEKFRFLELLIIAFYGVEFVHLLTGETLKQESWPWAGLVAAGALVVVSGVLYFLAEQYLEREENEREEDRMPGETGPEKPADVRKKTGRPRRLLMIAIGVILLLAVAYVGAEAFRHRHHTQESIPEGSREQKADEDRLHKIESGIEEQKRMMEELIRRSQTPVPAVTSSKKKSGIPAKKR